MTSGSRTWRAAGGFAALTIAGLAGCNSGSQVARLATAPNRPQSVLATAGRAALLPATVALDSPSEMGAIEPSGASAGTTEPAPTPLLDAALVQSHAVAEIVVGEMAPKVEPAEAVPAPVAHPVVKVEPPEPAKVEVQEPVPPEPLRPEEIWRDELHRLVALARSKSEQPGGDHGPWNLRSRVLEWLAGSSIDPDLGQPDRVRTVLRVLDDPANPPRTRGDDLRAAVQVLEDKVPLELVELKLCSAVRQFDDYDAYDSAIRKPGQQVVIYTEVDGLRQESTSAGFRTRLVGQVEIFPAEGGTAIFAKALGDGPVEQVSRRFRRDYFIASLLTLPTPIPPGSYRLRLTWKDILADRSASREVGLTIVHN